MLSPLRERSNSVGGSDGSLSPETLTRMYRNWSKSITELPIFKDLPRLIRGIKIYNPDGGVVRN